MRSFFFLVALRTPPSRPERETAVIPALSRISTKFWMSLSPEIFAWKTE
jgi:hypothetical protein